MITQNVDLLHTKAGSRRVINLHGTYARVVCLDCGHGMSRLRWRKLEAANPGFAERTERVGISGGSRRRRRGNRHRHVSVCRLPRVRRHARPDIVYFGEVGCQRNRPTSVCTGGESGALLVAGSSLTVFSGYQFRPPCCRTRDADCDRQPRRHPRGRPGGGQG